MSLPSPRKKPSERNVNIYYAVRADERSLQEVGEEHKITPQRVSKIVRTVAAWMLKKAGRDTTVPCEQSFLAHDVHLHSLRRYKLMAIAAFEMSCQEKIGPKDCATPGKWIPPKPDIRCLAKAMDADKQIEQTTIAMAYAQSGVVEEAKKEESWWQERDERLMKKETRAKEKRKQAKLERQRRELAEELASMETRSMSEDLSMSETALRATELNQKIDSSWNSIEPQTLSDQDHGQARATQTDEPIFAVPPPAGAMMVRDENDPEGRSIVKNARGETIWLVETYDFGEDRTQPIESADGRCFAGKLMWRTEAEIEDEFERRKVG
jgi:hypothetical protein